jgi:hypothetical protein
MVRHDQPRNFCEYLCVGLFLCVTAILLCACGEGSSWSTPPPPQNPLPAIASSGRCFGSNGTNHRAPGGGVSTGATLTIDNPVPAISKVNPASALAGSSDTLLDVSGSGFFLRL